MECLLRCSSEWKPLLQRSCSLIMRERQAGHGSPASCSDVHRQCPFAASASGMTKHGNQLAATESMSQQSISSLHKHSPSPHSYRNDAATGLFIEFGSDPPNHDTKLLSKTLSIALRFQKGLSSLSYRTTLNDTITKTLRI